MRVLNGGLAAALWLAAVGCDRGAQGSAEPLPRSGLTPGTAGQTGAGVDPGISPEVVLGLIENPFADDPGAAATGRQLFTGFNCSGCHAGYAGGGMGPNLRDTLWIYGSKDAQIFSTIAEGRPYGMPAWGGRIPDNQIWMLVSYIKTLGTPAEPVKPPVPSQRKVRAAPEPESGG
jgi:cytochrome c oxidase cbb3-type subunit 3